MHFWPMDSTFEYCGVRVWILSTGVGAVIGA